MITINSFWDKDKLSLMEKLTIKSFIDHGHKFCLYTYKDINYNVEGLEIKDANEIINFKDYFLYEGFGDCPKNSVGGFSDIFRFFLLKKIGGWYTDMDVTCLKNFSDLDKKNIVLRPHNRWKVVANIIKLNDSKISEKILNRYNVINSKNNDWALPIRLLTEELENNSLINSENLVDITVFGNDDPKFLYNIVKKDIFSQNKLPSHAIHWCNTAVTTGNWDNNIRSDWNKPAPLTLLYCLCKKHELI